ncbi:MAG: hypothetical protein RLZ47_639 [Bacteroidota bacterium]
MSAKSIFIICVTILLTVILMNNNDEMVFWIFGEAKVPKLGVLAGVFFIGWLIGFLMGRPKSKTETKENFTEEEVDQRPRNSFLSEEDQEYIS